MRVVAKAVCSADARVRVMVSLWADDSVAWLAVPLVVVLASRKVVVKGACSAAGWAVCWVDL